MIYGGPRTVVAPDLLLLDSKLSTAAVTERTEGWPAGLYLAAVIAAGHDGEPVTVSGS
jgi:hypothetical protein